MLAGAGIKRQSSDAAGSGDAAAAATAARPSRHGATAACMQTSSQRPAWVLNVSTHLWPRIQQPSRNKNLDRRRVATKMIWRA